MADLKIKRIKIENWARFKTVDLEFPDKGLVMVLGNNGAGKTALGEALCRTLLGITGRFAHVKDMSTDAKGDTYVCVDTVFRGTPLTVENGYRTKRLSSTGEALRYTLADEAPVERGMVGQTRASLAKLLGIDPVLASWSVFVDGDNLEFHKLPQADRVSLVMSALKQPPWTVFHENAKTVCARVRKELTKESALHAEALRRVETATRSVAEAETILSDERQLFELSQSRQKSNVEALAAKEKPLRSSLKKADDERSEIRKKIKKLEDEQAEASHALEIQRNENRDAHARLSLECEPFKAAKSKAATKLALAQQAKSDYVASEKTCPTCGAVSGKKLDANRLNALTEAVQAARDSLLKAENELDAKLDELDALDAALEKLDKNSPVASMGQTIRSLSQRDRALETDILDLKDDLSDLLEKIRKLEQPPSNVAVISAQAKLEERQQQRVLAEQTLKDRAQNLAECQATVSTCEYWLRAFGPSGIPNMILREAIAPLNAESARISKLLSGGRIALNYSTTRTLANTDDRPELVVQINNRLGCSKIEGNSKGEAGLANFIIEETLTSVGQIQSKIGFRWFDEVLKDMDTITRGTVLAYLKEMANRFGILIFIVDHHTETANYADHVLLVEKTETNGIANSTLSWTT